MDLMQSELYKADIERVVSSIDLSVFKNNTFLITGGLGLICSAVIDVLAYYEIKNNDGIRIIVGARDESQFFERYGDYSFIQFWKYDALSNNIFTHNPNYIIHGAGLASPDKYVSMPVETMLTNIKGVTDCLDYSVQANVKTLLYISSSEVYGIKETDKCYAEEDYGYVDLDSLRSSYSVGKRAGELLCKSFASEYGVNTVVARPGHIFGPSATQKDKRVSSLFAYQAASGNCIELKSSGLQKRSYQYSLDCAKALLILLLKGEKGESYNVGSEKVTTIREMAECYARAGNVELITAESVQVDKSFFNPMDNASLCIDKIKRLGYYDSFSVYEGFEHTIRIIRDLINR